MTALAPRPPLPFCEEWRWPRAVEAFDRDLKPYFLPPALAALSRSAGRSTAFEFVYTPQIVHRSDALVITAVEARWADQTVTIPVPEQILEGLCNKSDRQAPA